jgi:hypothetical protein
MYNLSKWRMKKEGKKKEKNHEVKERVERIVREAGAPYPFPIFFSHSPPHLVNDFLHGRVVDAIPLDHRHVTRDLEPLAVLARAKSLLRRAESLC